MNLEGDFGSCLLDCHKLCRHNFGVELLASRHEHAKHHIGFWIGHPCISEQLSQLRGDNYGGRLSDNYDGR